MSLVQQSIEGDYGFNLAYVGSPLDTGGTPLTSRPKGVCPLAALKGDPIGGGEQTLTVVVGSGVPCLMGGATTSEGAFPSGATFTLTDPNGNSYDEQQTANDCIVLLDGSSVSSFCIGNPTPGTWTLTAHNLPDDDVHVYMSTMPTEHVHHTMDHAIREHLDTNVVGAIEADHSWGCWVCTIVAWIIGVILAGAAFLGAAYFTPEVGPILSLVSYTGWEALTASRTVQFLLGAGIGVVTLIVANICAWTGACTEATPVTATIEKPSNGDTVAGTYGLTAITTGSTQSVYFYVDWNPTPVGSDRGNTPYHMQFDTTTLSNGSHVVSALAVDSENVTTQSAAVTFNISN